MVYAFPPSGTTLFPVIWPAATHQTNAYFGKALSEAVRHAQLCQVRVKLLTCSQPCAKLIGFELECGRVVGVDTTCDAVAKLALHALERGQIVGMYLRRSKACQGGCHAQYSNCQEHVIRQ